MPSALSRRRNQEEEDSDEQPTQSTQKRSRRPAAETSDDEEDVEGEADAMDVDGDEADSQEQVVKKLIRYALSCEFQRMPIKRDEITKKVLSAHRVPFKRVFEEAQKQLRNVFGMQMVELPAREKVTLKERRAAASSKGTSKSTGGWILTTILPSQYRTHAIIPPAAISSTSEEAAYIGIYTLIVAFIQLSPTHSIPDHKFTRYLNRLNAAENMPMDKTANIIAKMQKQKYIVKVVDRTDNEDTIDWRVGPRGLAEIGNRGIEGLIKAVYGETPPNDLQSRIDRSLGLEVPRGREEEAEAEPEVEVNGGLSRRKSRRNNADVD